MDERLLQELMAHQRPSPRGGPAMTVVEMATPVPAEDGLFAVLMPNGTRHPSGLTSELERAEAVARELWDEGWDVTVARMQLRLDAFRAERGAS